MASEVELKLELPSNAADRIGELPWLNDLACGPAKRQKLVTVYFDTAKQKLRAQGLSLRVRHTGGKRIQTIKVENKGAGGAFGRDEWEHEIASDRPDLKLAAGTALENVAGRKLKRKLRAVFETVIERISIPLRCNGSTLELALDRGLIRGGGRRQAVSEIEIEVKDGDPAALAAVAERLAQSLPVTYGARSKAERGYLLCGSEAGQPARQARITLNTSTTTGEAFAAIGLSCLKQVTSNRDAVVDGKAEGIHQMRVGLRRLRAAISIFKPMVHGAETEAVKRELEWLTDELTPAREYEVLIEGQVMPLSRAGPDTDELRTLNTELQARRERGLDRARKAAASERFGRLGLRTALWLANGASNDPLARTRRERPAVDFAAAALARRTRKIVKKLGHIGDLNPRQRHKLRIVIQKLRYAGSFFASLFAARNTSRRKAFERILKGLQGSLGILTDIAAHRHLAGDVVNPPRPIEKKAAKSFAMGFIAGTERRQIARCLAGAKKLGSKLAATAPFWQ